MEIVKDYEFSGSRGRGKYAQLMEEFLALPPGTTVRLVEGRDFHGDAKKFSLSLRTTLWAKGYRARINVRPDGVYAALVGKREPTESEVAAGVTDPTQKRAAKAAPSGSGGAKQPRKAARSRQATAEPRVRGSRSASVAADPLKSPFAVPGR